MLGVKTYADNLNLYLVFEAGRCFIEVAMENILVLPTRWKMDYVKVCTFV